VLVLVFQHFVSWKSCLRPWTHNFWRHEINFIDEFDF